jgi:Flp pilus assembly protein TadG
MVEFAIVLPVLCMVLFGIVQFGIVYNNYLIVTDAARVGARKAAVSRQAANPSAVAKAAARTSAASLDQAKFDVVVTAPVWAPGADVKVEATYPYGLNLFGKALISGTLRSHTTERIE